MIERGVTSPTGWTTYRCTECGGIWHFHAHEKPVTRHTKKECAEVQAESAELQALMKKHPEHPANDFTYSALTGKWHL